MLDTLMARACTVTTVTATGDPDVFNDPTVETTDTDTRCYLEQRRAFDTTSGLSVATGEWLCLLPGDVTITAGDRVTVDEDEFEVDGPPWPVQNPRTGTTSHIEVNLRRTS